MFQYSKACPREQNISTPPYFIIPIAHIESNSEVVKITFFIMREQKINLLSGTNTPNPRSC